MLMRTGNIRRFVDYKKSVVKPQRPDRGLEPQSESDGLGDVARLYVSHAGKHVACVGKDYASNRPPQRKSYLVTYDQNRVPSQRAEHQNGVAISIFYYIAVRIAFGHQYLRSGLFKAKASQV